MQGIFSIIPCIILLPFTLMFFHSVYYIVISYQPFFSLVSLPYVICYIRLTSTKINNQPKPSFDIRKFPFQNSSGDQVHWKRFIAFFSNSVYENWTTHTFFGFNEIWPNLLISFFWSCSSFVWRIKIIVISLPNFYSTSCYFCLFHGICLRGFSTEKGTEEQNMLSPKLFSSEKRTA